MIGNVPISHAILLIFSFGLSTLSFSFFMIWAYAKMPSLNNAPAEIAIPSMNALNKANNKLARFSLYLLTPITYCGCGLLAQSIARNNGALFFYLGTILYVIGVLTVTITINEPLNFQLTQVKVSDTVNSHKQWQLYFKKWQFWNKMRALSSGLALGLFFLGTWYFIKG